MKALYVFLAWILTIPFSVLAQEEKVSMLVITGGHDFDRNAFFNMLNSFNGLKYQEKTHPNANDVFESEAPEKYDVILFYDSWQEINEQQKKGFEELVKRGCGLVFLHHSLVNYQSWDFYKEVMGGSYILASDNKSRLSNYKHDVSFDAVIVEKDHPITKGVSDFPIFDEIYGNVWVSNKIQNLVETTHAASMNPIVWCNEIEPATRTVYIQPGHGPQIFSNDSYRKILLQSILWAAFQY